MVKKWIMALGLVLVLSVGFQSRAQDQTLVIEGGTLLDGNGGAPVKNAVVVIEGNRFKAVGVKGKVTYPKTAKVIKADGKTILPGLIDTQAQGNWPYQPPLWIYFGFTTVYVDGSPYMKAEKEAQEKGQMKGPKMHLAYAIEGPPELQRPDKGARAKLWPEGWATRTPDEARAAVRKRIAEGAEAIIVDEAFSPEMLRAASDEAHKNGITIGGHSEFASMTSVNGQDYTYHMAGVIRAAIASPESVAKLKEMKEKHWEQYYPTPLGLYEYMMEPATFDPMIKNMVAHHFFIAPTIAHTWWTWGTQIPHSKEWQATVMDFAKNTPGLDFVPQKVRELWLRADKTTERVTGRWPVGDQFDATHPQDMEGYAKQDDFLRRFVKAGGKIMGGSDNSSDYPPGLCSHIEMQQLVYSGLTPMQAIMSVTKWAAESWHKDKEIGTIEAGKTADLITVNGDPLADIKNTRNVDLVIQDGKVIDRALDPNWKNPVPTPQRRGE
jgi:amidohydrolase family protein